MWKKLPMVDDQLPFVGGGGASRKHFLEDAPKAHPKMTSGN
jgi:hypothetical protein